MSFFRELFGGIAAALLTSLLAFGALAVAVTEGMVAPDMTEPTSAPVQAETSSVFPGLTTSTARPASRPALQTPPPAAPTCPAVPDWDRYTLLAGDTLAELASSRGVSVDELIRANCLVSKDVMAGSKIYLPRPTPSATPAPLTPTATLTTSVTPTRCAPPRAWFAYTVQSGDTLYRIASLSGLSVYELQRSNCSVATIIHPGDVIFVPSLAALRPTATTAPSSTPQPPANTSTSTSTRTPVTPTRTFTHTPVTPTPVTPTTVTPTTPTATKNTATPVTPSATKPTNSPTAPTATTTTPAASSPTGTTTH